MSGITDKDLTDEEKLVIVRAIHEVDACEFCDGTHGTPGNENIIVVDGVEKAICDYCHSNRLNKLVKETSDTVKKTGSTMDAQLASTIKWKQAMGR